MEKIDKARKRLLGIICSSPEQYFQKSVAQFQLALGLIVEFWYQ